MKPIVIRWDGGVRFTADGAETESMVMRVKSGTVRTIRFVAGKSTTSILDRWKRSGGTAT